MIKVIFENGHFNVKGTFSIGIAGVVENKDFGDENIKICDTLEDILMGLNDENSYYYKPLFPYLKGKENDGDAIAQGLEDYYNHKETEMKENIKQINDCILFHLFWDLTACGYPFWEIEEAIIPGALDNYDINNLEAEIYTKDRNEEVFRWRKDFWNKPNNGTMQKTDVEGKLKKMFPMFNFDGLYQSITEGFLSFKGRFINYGFSDGWGECLLECAYIRLDENFSSCDWHNH